MPGSAVCGTACGSGGLCDDAGNCIPASAPTVCGLNPQPKPNEVIVWQDPPTKDKDGNPVYTGNCATLTTGSYPTSASFQPVANKSISAIRVGCGVRALLYHDAATQDSQDPMYWYSGGHRATFEAGSSHDLNADSSIFQLGPNVENDVSAIIVEPVVDQSGVNRRVAYSFLGDYPADSGAPLINKEPQGLAHSDTDWFFTNTWAMFKVPLTGNVDSGEYKGLTCLANLDKGSSWLNTDIPGWLSDLCSKIVPPAGIAGCDHMGDPDQAQGYVFVPMEGCDGGKAKVAVYRASDLSFVGADPLLSANAGWVAIDPTIDPTGAHNLWTSDSARTLQRYTVNWGLLGSKQPPPITGFLKHIDCAPNAYCSSSPGVTTWSPRDSWPNVTDFNATLAPLIAAGQGGVFSPDGRILYLSGSDTGSGTDGGYHGILAVNADTGEMLTKTGDNYGPFNYQREYTNQEEEGIDYLDTLDYYWNHNHFVLPLSGELHAALNFEDNHNLSIKHYTAWPGKLLQNTAW